MVEAGCAKSSIPSWIIDEGDIVIRYINCPMVKVKWIKSQLKSWCLSYYAFKYKKLHLDYKL